MSTTRPTAPNWRMDNMLAWLTSLQHDATQRHGSEAAYIHPKPITYTNADQKVEWAGYQEDSEARDAIQKFEKANHNRSKVWIALCDTPNRSYVGIELSDEEKASGIRQWDKVDWHSWGLIAAASSSTGKHLYIFDCDQELPEKGVKFHARDLVTQAQRQFVSTAKKWGIKRLFVGNSGADRANRDQCLNETTEWVEKMASMPATEIEDGDERFAGFVEIGLNT